LDKEMPVKKLPLLAATCALSLWGCAHSSDAREEGEPPMQEIENVDTQTRKDRQGAPTVYDGEVSGDSGSHSTVTTPDGRTWDVQEEPHGDEPKVQGQGEATGGSGASDVKEDSEVIDEGPTEEVPKQ
jgi:hypothetical protein